MVAVRLANELTELSRLGAEVALASIDPPAAQLAMNTRWHLPAVGPAAQQLTAGHRLVDGCGEGSPLARLYGLDGRVLLLGVGHDSNTSLHLAEYRAGVRRAVQQTAPVLVTGTAKWVTWDDSDPRTSRRWGKPSRRPPQAGSAPWDRESGD